MQKISADSDYRSVLREELERRCHADARYSLNSFSRDLGLAPSRLSEIFSEKQGLSRERAEKIAKKIGLSEKETERFCDLVEMEHARSAEKRALARIRIQNHSLEFEYSTLEEASFRVVSDWYHFAIVQLTELKTFKNDANWIASRLHISRAEAVGGMERLLRIGVLIKEKDRLRASREFLSTTDNVSSEAIRNFHKQILERAAMALSTQSPETRNFSANFMTIDRGDLPTAKEALKKFRRKFVKDLDAKAKRKNSVYCLAMQFFAVANGEDEK